jgi:hypothetical protein
MRRPLKVALFVVALASLTSASYAQDFNNWTTESLKLIFIPASQITYAHGKTPTGQKMKTDILPRYMR